jgi:hypothetical protein
MVNARILLLSIMVVLAGCAGSFAGNEATPEQDSPTPTPTPTPVESPIPSGTVTQTATPTAAATATASEQDETDNSRAPFRRFVRKVDARTAVAVEGEYVNDSVIRLTTANDIGDREFDAEEGIFPVPQATAYVIHDSAAGVYQQDHLTPERVEFAVRYKGTVAQTFALDRATAVDFARLSITNGEFRQRIRASLSNTSTHPGAQLLQYVSGERRSDTRMATARAVKIRIEDRLAARIGPENVGNNITDAGIYADPVTFNVSDGNVTYPAGNTIYVEFRIPRDGGQEFLGDAKRSGVSLNQTMLAWADVAESKPYGDVPANIRMRFVDLNGTLYWTVDVPRPWANRYNLGGLNKGEFLVTTLFHFLETHN